MATVNLGSIKFKWKGAYAGGTAYTVDDVVSYNGSSYICIQASTGNLPTDTAYFEQMSQAGTDGTDVGTTITTQGDILYRDGSGLASLSAGTSGQVLTTGGSGANPTWETVSSDFVKLGSGEVTSTTNNLSIDGYYDSDYKNYKLYLYDIRSSIDTFDLRWRVNIGSTAQTGSSYYYTQTGAYTNTSSVATDWRSGEMAETRYAASFTMTPNADSGNFFVFDILNPQDTTGYNKGMLWSGYINDTRNSWFVSNNGGGFYYSGTSALSGLTFFGSVGSIEKCKWELYGLK